MIDRRTAWMLLVCSLAGCSRDVSTGRRCDQREPVCAAAAQHPGAAGAGGKGAAGNAGTAGSSAVRSGENALSVRVDDIAGMEIEIITLACAGDCAEIEAVARGGNPPYAFTWEDGSTAPRRNVCLDASTTLHVSARDTAIESDELGYEAQSVSADVTATVLTCDMPGGTRPDGGLPDDTSDCADSVEASFVVSPAEANPNGNWSYGWSQSLGSAFTLYPTFYPVTVNNGPYGGPGWPAIAQWFDETVAKIGMETYYSVPPIPDVLFNPTASPAHPAEGNLAGNSYTVAAGQLALTPGTAGQYSIARWTAPDSGSYAIRAVFDGLCGDNGLPKTTADVHVQHNGGDLTAGSIDAAGAGNSFAFSQRVDLAAGDTVDFAVGAAGGVFLCPDVTALHATVCKQ